MIQKGGGCRLTARKNNAFAVFSAVDNALKFRLAKAGLRFVSIHTRFSGKQKSRFIGGRSIGTRCNPQANRLIMYEALFVFLIVAIGLVGLIMLQQGKGAFDMVSLRAGASATPLFGSSGSGNFMTRMTAVL